MISKKKKVVVGLSGGVDSTVTAKILKDKGFEVVGVFFENFDNAEGVKSAQKAAESLEIEFKTVDVKDFFEKNVRQKFYQDILDGKTPNPCVDCNKVFKFGYFLDIAKEKLEADFFATGHYVKIYKNKQTDQFELKIPKDLANDQTYFLHKLSQDQLKNILFPLADLTKDEVRELAKKAGFPNFDKKSSSDICFLKDENYADFVRKNFTKKTGKIIDFESGKVLGNHDGSIFFTIGQRKNLGIGGIKGFPEKPFFVVKKDHKENIVYVSQNEELLSVSEIVINNLSFVSGEIPEVNENLEAKIRFRTKNRRCKIIKNSEKKLVVQFEEPVFAPAAGQFCVFYNKDVCLGGGEIV